jgi:hypothetical protein
MRCAISPPVILLHLSFKIQGTAKDWNFCALHKQISGHAERFQLLHGRASDRAGARAVRACRLLIDDRGISRHAA